MAKSMSPRNDTERLFDSYFSVEKNWSSAKQVVANVFNAFPTRAFSIEQIAKIANAVDSVSEDFDFKPVLSALVRAKVLRARKGRFDSKLYEVNY